MQKTELMMVFEAAKDLPFMAVVVETGRNTKEAIVFKNKDFDHKKFYYDRAYDENMAKVDNPLVKVIAAEAGHTIDLELLLHEPEMED